MIGLYCANIHRTTGALCEECEALWSHAQARLERCPFQENKPTCAQCPIHCYQPKLRDQMRAVMRHAGPRMLWRHPILAVKHMLDARREAPPR